MTAKEEYRDKLSQLVDDTIQLQSSTQDLLFELQEELRRATVEVVEERQHGPS